MNRIHAQHWCSFGVQSCTQRIHSLVHSFNNTHRGRTRGPDTLLGSRDAKVIKTQFLDLQSKRSCKWVSKQWRGKCGMCCEKKSLRFHEGMWGAFSPDLWRQEVRKGSREELKIWRALKEEKLDHVTDLHQHLHAQGIKRIGLFGSPKGSRDFQGSMIHTRGLRTGDSCGAAGTGAHPSIGGRPT